jgi:hypothetical protein
MRFFEKRSACLDGHLSLLKRYPYKFEFHQILSRYVVDWLARMKWVIKSLPVLSTLPMTKIVL